MQYILWGPYEWSGLRGCLATALDVRARIVVWKTWKAHKTSKRMLCLWRCNDIDTTFTV